MKTELLILVIIVSIFGCSSKKNETQSSENKTTKDNNDYYENGNIRIERKRLENGDSLWIFRQEDGGCWEEDFYYKGEIYKKIVYNSDCSKSAEYELKDGKRHGSWKSFHENGKLRESVIYINGIPKGGTHYFDEDGKIIQFEQHVQLDSLSHPFFNGVENELYELKKYLSLKGINFKEDFDIKVAGNHDYHFPILTWANSELHFDLIENNNVSECLEGTITEPKFIFFNGIKIGDDIHEICQKMDLTLPHEINTLCLHDLKAQKTYCFEFVNEELKKVRFGALDIRS